MPIRQNFGCWSKFVIACGKEPRKPEISGLARANCIKSRLGRVGGNNKGGKYKDSNGYIHVWMPEHENSRGGGYVSEHRLVMSKMIGRPLDKKENVHHKNGDRSDNRPENLELWVSIQPSGQRVSDLVDYAKFILNKYGNIHQNSELLK